MPELPLPARFRLRPLLLSLRRAHDAPDVASRSLGAARRRARDGVRAGVDGPGAGDGRCRLRVVRGAGGLVGSRASAAGGAHAADAGGGRTGRGGDCSSVWGFEVGVGVLGVGCWGGGSYSYSLLSTPTPAGKR